VLSDSIIIGGITSSESRRVMDSVLSINVNYSITESTQLTIRFIDPNLRMAANNYFTVGRDLTYTAKAISPYLEDFGSIRKSAGANNGEFARRRTFFEMASVTVDQSGAFSPIWTVKARPKAIQQMKRDRKPKNIKGSGSQFVINACRKYGLYPVTQRTSKSYKINNAQGAQQATSVWDAMKSIADEAEFVMFEVDGVLYFGQEKWLINKWGTFISGGELKYSKEGKVLTNPDGTPQTKEIKRYIPFIYPPVPKLDSPLSSFRLIGIPTLTQSDNDAYIADGSLVCERKNGVRLRPGMTAKIIGVPNFLGEYLITDVSFQEQSTEAVAVTFRSPEKLEKDKIKEIRIGEIITPGHVAFPGYLESTAPLPLTVASNAGTFSVSEINPLPTKSQPMIYPRYPFSNEFVDESGNISLWNRPVSPFDTTTRTAATTTEPFVHYDSTKESYMVLEKVWCIGGVPQVISDEDAISKYETEGVNYGGFSNEEVAKQWIKYLYRAQEVILSKRFKNFEKIFQTDVNTSGLCP